MSLRAIQQFVIHVQSFRNIDLWYQGAYLLQIQLYKQMKDKNLKQKIYAHPFAFTEEHLQNNCQVKFGDTQIIKKASISNETSSFLTKAYLLKYYEQQVQINDIVHFRIQTDISFEEDQFILQFNLLFFDQQIKKLDPDQITLQKAKITKTKKYFIKNSKKGIHEYIPLMFQGQYFSIANIVIHTLCVDYRYRLCPLQLYQFSRLSPQEKKKLLQKNKKISCKEIDYFDSITHTLKLAKNFNSIQQIQQILIKNFKKSYKSLLKQYRHLFSRVITSYHKQYFSHLLINPNDLGLYEDEMPLNNSLGWQQKIELKYKSKNLNMIIQNMLNQTNLIAGQLLKLWHYFIDIIKISPRFTYAHYEDVYMKSKQILWNKFRRVTLNQNKFLKYSYLEQHEEHMKIEKQLIVERNKLILETDVVSQQFLLKKNNLSLMIQDVYGDYIKKESEDATGDQLFKVNNLHLVVLVHGFQGNSIDMKLIKNNCSFFYPEVAFLCSSANQQLTDTDIIQMGNRLANEIRNYISQYFPPDSLERISFIGHSLGGVIIRAALPRLLDMKQKFHTLITFSSPHLGYKVNASSVIEAGIWFLQKFKNSNCLKQLTLGDNANLKETTLYKISKFQGLKYFKDIFLFSSKQDSYAPFQSARIQIHPQFMNTKDLMKQIHCEMVNNILNDISPKQMHRIIVNFTIQETNLDSLIGRTAHILFLQNSQLIQMFLMTHPDIFA